MDQNMYDYTLIDDDYDPNGYGLDPASGDTVANDPQIAQYGTDQYGDTIGNVPQESPNYFPDPGANSGGSMTESGGGSGSGGSGFGTFLAGLGNFTGQFLRGAGIVNGSPTGTPQGRTTTGAPCVLGTAGCMAVATAPGAASSQVTMMVLVGVGAIILIIALRGK